MAAWRVVAAVLIFIFSMAIVAGPVGVGFSMAVNDIMDTGDYNADWYGGESQIDNLLATWWEMPILAVFGVFVWGFAWVVKRELFEGRQPP